MTEEDVKRLIAEAVGEERKRTAALIREVLSEPEGDYVGYEERFQPDWPRTFAILAGRIEHEPGPPRCDGCGHAPHFSLLCSEPSCMCSRDREQA